MNWQRTLLLATGLGIGATAVFLPNSTPSLEKKVEISFEQAKSNPSRRQDYLDYVLEKKDVYGVDGWESFEGFVYDPKFERKSIVRSAANNYLLQVSCLINFINQS